MKTVLICHEGYSLTQIGIARWMASFSDLVGVIVLQEQKKRFFDRIRFEIRRVGYFRLIDVLAMRIYYRLFLYRNDKKWENATLAAISKRYKPLPDDVPILYTYSPNSDEAYRFLLDITPDIVLARCKTLLKPAIFNIATTGTLVTHPGICPEYRNAHGCFWALANDDNDKVGMTLLKIDEGIDTGPVYGYYTYNYDEVNESHIVIQNRTVLENLDELSAKFNEIYNGNARSINTGGRASGVWGQPWLSRYLQWKRKARRRNR